MYYCTYIQIKKQKSLDCDFSIFINFLNRSSYMTLSISQINNNILFYNFNGYDKQQNYYND